MLNKTNSYLTTKQAKSKQSSSSNKLTNFTSAHLSKMLANLSKNHLFPYVMDCLPREVLQIAMLNLCYRYDPLTKLDSDQYLECFFIPWLYYCWIPEVNFNVNGFEPNQTIAQNYTLLQKSGLSPAEKKFINYLGNTYYTYYLVIDVAHAHSIIVEDIISGEQSTVSNATSYTLEPNTIIFAQLLLINQTSAFVGIAPFNIPKKFMKNLSGIRELNRARDMIEMCLTDIPKKSFKAEMIELFFYLLYTATKPTPSLTSQSNDQYPTNIKLCYSLDLSILEAAQKLLPMTPFNHLSDLYREPSSNLPKKLTFIPWVKEQNTPENKCSLIFLGEIALMPGYLMCQTNSPERAKKAAKLIQKYLAKNVRFKSKLIAPALHENDPYTPPILFDFDNLLLQKSDPDLQQSDKAFENSCQHQWLEWLDIPLPALLYQTPRDAANSPQGRELISAVLGYIQEFTQHPKHGLVGPDLQLIGDELGISISENSKFSLAPDLPNNIII